MSQYVSVQASISLPSASQELDFASLQIIHDLNGNILDMQVKCMYSKVNFKGFTELHYVCAAGDVERARLLIHNGVSPDIKDALGCTCLYWVSMLNIISS